MTLEYPLTFEVNQKLFQKQYNSLIKKVFLVYKMDKELKLKDQAQLTISPPTYNYVYQ